MFTVQELVDQGYTVQHARQFVDRPAVRAKTEKAAHRSRKNGRAELAQAKREQKSEAPWRDTPALETRSSEAQEWVDTDITPSKTAVVRAWAKLNGHEVKAGGRLSKTVINAYNEAHK